MMTTSAREATSIASLLNPATVAVIGASRSLDKFGGRVLHNLQRNGFGGRLIAINSVQHEVQGVRAYPSISAVDASVDVAMLAVPADAAVDAVAECAAAGVGHCVIIATGFGEIGGKGAERQQRLSEIIQGTKTRLLGPNCLGLINLHNRLVLTSSISLTVDALPAAGRVGFISQSGAHMVTVFDTARQFRIPLASAVSVGNQADLEICDFLEYMVDDPSTGAICVYAEGFPRPARFLRAAEACLSAGKPLFLVKAGRTAAGVAAAQSHTASLAGSYAVIAAACRERGVVLANDPVSMIRAAAFLCRWGAPATDGVAVCSGSGGSISIAVDRVLEAGLTLAELAPETVTRLEEHVIAGHAANPVDLGFRIDPDAVAAATPIMSTVCSDPDVGFMLLMLGSVPFLPEMTRQLASALLAAGTIPLITVDAGTIADGARTVLAELDCPYLDDLADAIELASLLTSYKAGLARSTVDETPALGVAERWRIERAVAQLGDGPLGETQAKAVLESAAIPVNAGHVVAEVDSAVREAQRLGFPVVLKVAAAGIVHKSDVGGVRLNLRTEAELRAAWSELSATLNTQQFTLQEMVTDVAVELIVGVRYDRQYGPVVLVGAGGTLAELLQDVQIGLAPVGPRRASELLRGLRIWPLLSGALRGQALDQEAVIDVIERLSWVAAVAGEALIDLEINPLLVRRAGRGVVAVDARGSARSVG